ncbi:hypothetical protein CKW46_25560 [Mycobacterium liflandii]|nr:hypothetical protein CKW46_25560 [Mycobacterium liflandii]
MATTDVVCVGWQQVCVGAHHAGARCDVHLDGELLRSLHRRAACRRSNLLAESARRRRSGIAGTQHPVDVKRPRARWHGNC